LFTLFFPGARSLINKLMPSTRPSPTLFLPKINPHLANSTLRCIQTPQKRKKLFKIGVCLNSTRSSKDSSSYHRKAESQIARSKWTCESRNLPKLQLHLHQKLTSSLPRVVGGQKGTSNTVQSVHALRAAVCVTSSWDCRNRVSAAAAHGELVAQSTVGCKGCCCGSLYKVD
jgi:hypothetical protein